MVPHYKLVIELPFGILLVYDEEFLNIWKAQEARIERFPDVPAMVPMDTCEITKWKGTVIKVPFTNGVKVADGI